MATAAFRAVLNAAGNPSAVSLPEQVGSLDTAVDLVKTDTADAKTKIATAKVDTAAAKTSIATANTDTIAVSITALSAALDVLVADDVVPTQAHVNTAKAAYDTMAALLVTAKSTVASAKTLVDTADTSTGTAKTAVDLSDTDAGTAATLSQLDADAISGGIYVAVDLSVIATVSKLRKLFNESLFAASGDGRFTG
jgi:hypothetical protein